MESSRSRTQSLQLGRTSAKNISLRVAAAILMTLGSLKAEDTPNYSAIVEAIESHRAPAAHKNVPIQHPPFSQDILRFG